MTWDPTSLALAALGGVMIGAASSLFYLLQGRIAGVSGIFGRALNLRPGAWRWAFLAGLVAAGLAARLLGRPVSPDLPATGPAVLALAGLLVGVGTTFANGCTSGHGICGLARFSPRSLASVVVFMAVAALTVFLVRHGGGGA